MERDTGSAGSIPVLDDHIPTVDYLPVDGILARLRVGFSCRLSSYMDVVTVRGHVVKVSFDVCTGGPSGLGGIRAGIPRRTHPVRFAPTEERRVVHCRVLRRGGGGFNRLLHLERGTRAFGC